ncbi:MAG: hypothetical protein OQK81_01885 [Candidatus Bathyarchaeota archaeon]|nr:hypothetical protein [Candidatus Bathyarchaeota archaeon]
MKNINELQAIRKAKVNEMKEWQVTLGASIVMFVAGIAMFLWGNNLEIPTTYFGYNDYFLVSNQYFTVYLTGVLFIGFSGAFLICTLLIYQLEQKISKLEKTNQ